MGVRGQAASFLEPERRPDVGAAAEGRAGGAERAGDDEQVAGAGARRGRERARERPTAVTETTSESARVVSPPTIGTPGSARPS